MSSELLAVKLHQQQLLTIDSALRPSAMFMEGPAVRPLHLLPLGDELLIAPSSGVHKHPSKRSVSAEISGCSGVCCPASAGCVGGAMASATAV